MAPTPVKPERLLIVARELASENAGRGRPSPTSLRRAISSAYYALFHSITLQAAAHLLPYGSEEQRLKLARTFDHGRVAIVCGWISQQGFDGPDSVADVAVSLRTTPIVNVAGTFRDLQEERHGADYDHLRPISKAAARTQVAVAAGAITALENCSDQNRSAFFTLLALAANPKR